MKTAGDGADLHQELQCWRESMLDGLVWAVCGTGAVAVAISFTLTEGPFARTLTPFLAAFLLTAALRGRVHHLVRVGLFLGLLYGMALATIARGGFAPNGLALLETLIVLSALLLGRRWALATTAMCAATLVGMWELHSRGVTDWLTIRSVFTAAAPDSWRGILRITVNFSVLSTVSVVALSYLLDRAESSLADKSRALDELRRQQAEADRLRDELRRKEEAFANARELAILGRLAGTVAHDFNNALLIIRGNADLVRHDPSVLPSALDEIDAAVFQAASTTRQLRGLWQQSVSRPVKIELREAIGHAAKLLRRLLPSNVVVKSGAEEDVYVMADEGQLQSLLINLALNARDAMPEGGHLELRVREATETEAAEITLRRRFALIEVTDTGSGMSPETQARLFEPYFTTKGQEGTGLGLASVKTIVEGIGGCVAVSSEVGRGTRFQIFWPLAEGTTTSGNQPVAPFATGEATVLIVDDNPHVRSVVASAMRQRGFTVLSASDGADAMVVARRHQGKIDILCSDCVMPGTPVRQMVQRFRDAHPGARVILCSGYAPDEASPPLDLVDAFVPKPFTPDALATIIGDLLTGRSVNEAKTLESA